MKINIGDKVIDDLTGNLVTIVDIKDRNEHSSEKIDGVKLIGDIVTVQNQEGKKYLIYPWEISEA